jgi:hypothetical protein
VSRPATAASLFDLVWATLVGILGTPAVAVLVRRAVKGAVKRRPDLDFAGLEVRHEALEYRYVLPPSWREDGQGSREALRHLLRDELCPLLEALTGQVVIGLLARMPELQRAEIFVREPTR